jgi:TolA-binding protein
MKLLLSIFCLTATALSFAQAPGPTAGKPAPPAAAAAAGATAPVAGKPAPAAPGVPVVTSEMVAYLLPPEVRSQIRDGQIEWDELEIDTQKMQVKIEQNKARQKDLTDGIRIAAYRFAQEKQIDLTLWELDPKALKFVKKPIDLIPGDLDPKAPKVGKKPTKDPKDGKATK